MLAAVIVTLLLAVGPTPGVGTVSVPLKMTYSSIYRIRSRSFLPSGLFYIINGVTDIQCYARCLLSTRCLSVNYKRANQMCEMSNMTVNAASSGTPINLTTNDEYHYMDKVDIPVGLIEQCGDSSDPGISCGNQSPNCSLDERIGYILEEKGNQLLAHTSCLINGRTDVCDTVNRSWRPHTPNCAGTPPQVRSNANYTVNGTRVTYECVDGNGIVTFSKYDEVTRSWSLPDLNCTPLPTNWEDPSPVAVPGVETFVVRPYDGVESRTNKPVVGDHCHVQHKCKHLTASVPVNSCPVSRCDGYFNWTSATLSCSVNDCFGGSSYSGRVSCTIGGIPCQRWDTQTPHGHTSLTDRSDLGNFCQFYVDPRPWCYTTDPRIRWDWCPVDDC